MISPQTNQPPLTQTRHSTLALGTSVNKTMLALTQNGFLPTYVQSKAEAFQKVRELIPSEVSVMNGASETLREIGFTDLLKSGMHPWNNLHEKILAETDRIKQTHLRRQSVLSDYYLGSAHAVTETGEIVVASNSGSQLAHLVFTSPNIVLIVGSQKIVPSITDAMKRLESHVIPLEDKRMMSVYGFGTTHAKTVILHKENPMMGRNIHVIIVNEKLGF